MFFVFFLSPSLSLLQDSCIACNDICYFRNLCVFVLRCSPHIATTLTIDVEAKIANEIWLNVTDQSPAAVARGDLVQVPWNTRQRFKVCDPSPCEHHMCACPNWGCFTLLLAKVRQWMEQEKSAVLQKDTSRRRGVPWPVAYRIPPFDIRHQSEVLSASCRQLHRLQTLKFLPLFSGAQG